MHALVKQTLAPGSQRAGPHRMKSSWRSHQKRSRCRHRTHPLVQCKKNPGLRVPCTADLVRGGATLLKSKVQLAARSPLVRTRGGGTAGDAQHAQLPAGTRPRAGSRRACACEYMQRCCCTPWCAAPRPRCYVLPGQLLASSLVRRLHGVR